MDEARPIRTDANTTAGEPKAPRPAVREESHKPHRHDSGHKHVTGEALYTDDVPTPAGTLHLQLGYADISCGTVTADTAALTAMPGVVAVLTADSVPGVNDIGPVRMDEPLFALSHGRAEVVYHGQPLCAVVATTRDAARRAARALPVKVIEQRPPVLTIADAIAADTPIDTPYTMAKSDARAAIDSAPHRVSGSMEIGGQEHFSLEGNVALALPGEDDEMYVLSSNQHPSKCQDVIARVLGTPAHAVTVEVRRLGGGFGGKETQGNLTAVAAALGARLTGKPVKCRLDRDDDTIILGKRHDVVIEYEAGFDDDGHLHGVRFVQHVRCGWALDLSAEISDRAMFHADNAYAIPALEVVSHRWRTNTCSNTAFRGFGGPQGMAGMERVIEHVAHDLGIDPLTVRRANFYRADQPAAARTTHFGMEVEDAIIAPLVDDLVASSDYRARRDAIAAFNERSAIIKKGIALTPVKFGISFTNTALNQAGALVHVYKDGSVMLNHGGIEMGQGVYIKVAQVVADAFGLPLSAVKSTATRTDKVPNTSPTAASAGTDLNAGAALNACEAIRGRLAQFFAAREGCSPDSVRFEDGEVRSGQIRIPFSTLVKDAYFARVGLSSTGYFATPKIHWDRQRATGRPFYYFAYGAAVSEAAIDTLTGETRLLRVDILHDVGRSLNPAIDMGQIEGGFVQGVGWLTFEELVWTPDGRLATHAPSTYKVPCASDRPITMNMNIWEPGLNREINIKRSKAVGEPPLMLAISAHQAIGAAIAAVRPDFHHLDAPATPERILRALTR